MNNVNDPAIGTDSLSKNFNGIQAVKSLSLKIPRHSIFGFLGPNGAGKSTAIKMLLGLTSPSSGTGSIFGFDIRTNSRIIRSRTGYLPQNPKFYDHMTAREILRFTAGFFFQKNDTSVEGKINEALSITGLSDKADRKVKGFSAGEFQRLGIAQAQINTPDLLILDEPAASLDPMGRRDVLEIMRSLRGKTTIFYSTHILEDVERISDMVGIIHNGQLLAQSPTHDLLISTDSHVYDIIISGTSDQTIRELTSEPWIKSVNNSPAANGIRYSFITEDEETAEKNLLRRLLSDENITVKEYIRRKYELSDVFMKIIEGDKND